MFIPDECAGTQGGVYEVGAEGGGRELYRTGTSQVVSPGPDFFGRFTRQELQQKIQANIGAALAKEFPGLNLPSGNLPSGDPAAGSQELKFDFHIEAKPGGGFSLHSHDLHSDDPNATTIEGASHEEIEHKRIRGPEGKLYCKGRIPKAELRQYAGSPANPRASAPRRKQRRYCERRRQLPNHS